MNINPALAALKAGDKVICNEQVWIVSRRTKTQIIVGNARFRLDGQGLKYHWHDLEPWSPERETEILAARSRAELYTWVREHIIPIRRLSDDQLRRIKAILEEGDDKGNI